MEFKNGFLQMASCSLLIETLACFLEGENTTPYKQANNMFNKVFAYANDKDNPLKEFKDKDFYDIVRCGILHQGETKGKYTITRDGKALLKDEKINAFQFHKNLKKLLKSYRVDLEQKDWNDPMWNKCRMKLNY